MKIELDSATLKTGNNVERIWKLRPAACTSCLTSFIGGKVLCRNVDTCSQGCLEIKCPYNINGQVTVSMNPTEISDKHPDFFMKMGDNNLLYLPPDHAYYAPDQGEMAVLDVEWCDFVVFSNDTVVVDQIIADYDYWMDLLEKLEQYQNFYLVKYFKKNLEQLIR